MRRNFYELATPGPAPIASESLKCIAEFYAIEKDIRGRSAEERRLIRQQKSQPLANAFEQWLRAKLGLISQKGKLAEAIRYALSRWDGLTRFIDDGRIELDNNAVERSTARSRSTGKMPCSRAPTVAPSIGPLSRL
jgi:transposase